MDKEGQPALPEMSPSVQSLEWEQVGEGPEGLQTKKVKFNFVLEIVLENMY